MYSFDVSEEGIFMREVYLDNAATTKLSKDAYDVMCKCLQDNYANPSSMHILGRNSRKIVEDSRKVIANTLGVDKEEIIFTSGATEADNMAILGVCKANSYIKKTGKRGHIITTKIEHKAVLNTCRYLENIGYEITYLDVDESGLISLDSVEKSIKDNTILISIMSVNNEIGTIMPINEIGKLARSRNILFHTDAVQGFGKISIDINNIDLMSISGHKIHASKGVGVLYKRKGIEFEECFFGGNQEYGMRPGTENIAGIASMGVAVKNVMDEFNDGINFEIKKKRDYLLEKIANKLDGVEINGDLDRRVTNNINISIEGVEGVVLVDQLSREGIYVSTGSACNASIIEPSYVLKAINKDDDTALSSIRMTLDNSITYEDLDYVVDKLVENVEDLREF